MIGHCGPDAAYLRLALSNAAGRDAAVVSIDEETELQAALERGIDLLLLNRQLDYGFAEASGVDLITRLRAIHKDLKIILVSNYPDAQAAAVKAGALPGFGKRELNTPRVKELLRGALGQ